MFAVYVAKSERGLLCARYRLGSSSSFARCASDTPCRGGSGGKFERAQGLKGRERGRCPLLLLLHPRRYMGKYSAASKRDDFSWNGFPLDISHGELLVVDILPGQAVTVRLVLLWRKAGPYVCATRSKQPRQCVGYARPTFLFPHAHRWEWACLPVYVYKSSERIRRQAFSGMDYRVPCRSHRRDALAPPAFSCAQAIFAGLNIADGALLKTTDGKARRPLTETSESVCGCVEYRDVLPRSQCGDAVLLKVQHIVFWPPSSFACVEWGDILMVTNTQRRSLLKTKNKWGGLAPAGRWVQPPRSLRLPTSRLPSFEVRRLRD